MCDITSVYYVTYRHELWSCYPTQEIDEPTNEFLQYTWNKRCVVKRKVNHLGLSAHEFVIIDVNKKINMHKKNGLHKLYHNE